MRDSALSEERNYLSVKQTMWGSHGLCEEQGIWNMIPLVLSESVIRNSFHVSIFLASVNPGPSTEFQLRNETVENFVFQSSDSLWGQWNYWFHLHAFLPSCCASHFPLPKLTDSFQKDVGTSQITYLNLNWPIVKLKAKHASILLVDSAGKSRQRCLWPGRMLQMILKTSKYSKGKLHWRGLMAEPLTFCKF